MKVQDTISMWTKDLFESHKRNMTRLQERITIFERNKELIESLPEELSYHMVYLEKIEFTALCENDIQVRHLIARIREVMNVKESTKKLNSGSGKLSYITEVGEVKTTVHGGDIPSNCRLIPKSHSYITYEMECKE